MLDIKRPKLMLDTKKRPKLMLDTKMPIAWSSTLQLWDFKSLLAISELIEILGIME
ncbi:MAG: hypothetical protein KAI83_16945 [Thiomargarita sp.]|nr:hypothetical protein [Thiomargarita sp.]